MEFENRTLKPLSMNLIAYNSPLHFSLTSFATPKFPDPISLIISYRSMVKLASLNWSNSLYNNYQQQGVVVLIEVCELANLSILLFLLDLYYLFACSIASFLWPPNSNAQKFAIKDDWVLGLDALVANYNWTATIPSDTGLCMSEIYTSI